MAVDLADLVNGQDVRVIQAGCRDRLALETLLCRRIDVAAKHLDRDWPMEPCIASAIHLSGAPFADQGFDAVGTDDGARGVAVAGSARDYTRRVRRGSELRWRTLADRIATGSIPPRWFAGLLR
jgi:hypothetical protein